jgi:hypothetical protein
VSPRLDTGQRSNDSNVPTLSDRCFIRARDRGGAATPIAQQLDFTPYNANGIYAVGETVGWTVVPGPVSPTYAYKWTIRRNNAVVLKEGKLDLSSGKDKIEITGEPRARRTMTDPH